MIKVVEIDYRDENKFEKLEEVYSNRLEYNCILYTDIAYTIDVNPEEIEKRLEKSEACCGLYFDIMASIKKAFFPIRYNPAMSHALFADKLYMNVPFVVFPDFAPKFNPEISSLHLWDGFLNVCRNGLLFHCAEPWVSMKDFREPYPDVEKDTKIIQEYV